MKRVLLGRYSGVLAGLLAVGAYLTVTEPVFLTGDNVTNIVRGNAVLFLLAVGMTFVVITAGIDLSVASLLTACVMVFGLAAEAEWHYLVGLAIVLGFGTILGLVNGILIGIARISFFVVTLGTLSIYQSFALLVNDGDSISLFSFSGFEPIKNLVNDDIGPLPVLLVVCGIVYFVAATVLRSTGFGRSIYAVGSNPEAARLTGVRVTVILVSVYAIAGFCAGLASVVQVGRVTSAAPQTDPTLLLTVIAAVLIGGTSYTGGEGGVLGTLIGVLFLGVVTNGLALSDVSTFWQGTVSGLILIIAVGLSELRHRGRDPGRSSGQDGPQPSAGQGHLPAQPLRASAEREGP